MTDRFPYLARSLGEPRVDNFNRDMRVDPLLTFNKNRVGGIGSLYMTILSFFCVKFVNNIMYKFVDFFSHFHLSIRKLYEELGHE